MWKLRLRAAILPCVIAAVAFGGMLASRHPTSPLQQAPQRIAENAVEDAERASRHAAKRNHSTQGRIAGYVPGDAAADRQTMQESGVAANQGDGTGGKAQEDISTRISLVACLISLLALVVSGFYTYVARQTMIFSQRSYITVKQNDIELLSANLGDIADIRVAPLWFNSGNTPAHKMSFYTSWAWIAEANEATFDFPITRTSAGFSVIGPGIGQQGPRTDAIAPSHFTASNDGRSVLLIYGATSYTDVFGYKHRTEFSCKASYDPLRGDRWPPRLEVTVRHNGADKDCLRKPYAKVGSPPRMSK